MKKKLFTIIATVIISALSLTSCSKDPEPAKSYTKSQLVGTYIMTGLTSNNVNEFAEYDECEKDNLQILNEDLTYEIIDAGQQCDPSSEENGVWSIKGNKLVMDEQTFTVENLTANQLIISALIKVGNITKNMKATYRRNN